MNKDIYKRLQKINERLKKEYHAEKVIVFGSYARGEETKDSDLDILVIKPTKERFYERMATVRRIIRDLRNGLAIAPLVLTPKEIKERKKIGDQFVLDILKNGITL